MKLSRFFKKESIVRSVLTLASGTVVAQLIAILIQPLLRRIIPVEDFGAYAVYMSVVGILATVITLRYDMAVVIPKKDEKASALVVGGISFAFLISIVLFGLIYFFHSFFLNYLGVSTKYHSWFYFLPATLFFAGSYRMLNNWLIRKKRFSLSASNKGIRRSTEAAFQTALSTSKISGSLVYGELIGSALNFSIGIYQSIKNGLQFKSISKTILKDTLKEYNHFPKFNILPVLLNNAAAWLPVIFITRFFSIETTGEYDLSRQVMAISLSLISMSVAQVYLQRIAEIRNRGEKILPDILNVSKILGSLAFIGILITLIVGPFLFGFVFGESYRISGEYAQIMVFSFGIRLIVSPLSVVFVNLERLKLNAVWQILYFFSILSLLLFHFSSIKDFLYTLVSIDLIAYSIYYGMIIYITKNYDNKIVSE